MSDMVDGQKTVNDSKSSESNLKTRGPRHVPFIEPVFLQVALDVGVTRTSDLLYLPRAIG